MRGLPRTAWIVVPTAPDRQNTQIRGTPRGARLARQQRHKLARSPEFLSPVPAKRDIYLAQVYPESSPEKQTWRLGGNSSSKLINDTCFMAMRPSLTFSRREYVSEAVLPRYSLDELLSRLLSVKGRLCTGLRQQIGSFPTPWTCRVKPHAVHAYR